MPLQIAMVEAHEALYPSHFSLTYGEEADAENRETSSFGGYRAALPHDGVHGPHGMEEPPASASMPRLDPYPGAGLGHHAVHDMLDMLGVQSQHLDEDLESPLEV